MAVRTKTGAIAMTITASMRVALTVSMTYVTTHVMLVTAAASRGR